MGEIGANGANVELPASLSKRWLVVLQGTRSILTDLLVPVLRAYLDNYMRS
jgi:hypothetical protein